MFYNYSTQTRQALKRPPKFSIIIPCYKVEKYIRACLDSVLVQKCDSWEVICTDDGSPDETGRVLDDYLREHFGNITEEERVIKAIGDEDRHPETPKRVLTGALASGARMMVVHQQNCGVSGARNTAMTLATGEWLVYLDGDDLLAPTALETLSRCLNQVPDADIIRCGYVNFNDGEPCVWPHDSVDEVQSIDISKEIPDAFGGCFQRMVFRRELVKDIAYKGVSCSEEMPYVLRCVIRGRKLILTNRVIYGYRVCEVSMSHRTYVTLERCEQVYDATRCMARLMAECDKNVPLWFSKCIINRWLEMQVDMITYVKDEKERVHAYNYWLTKLPKIRRYGEYCSLWQLMVSRVCIRLPWKPVTFCLCYVPHWLKSHGLNRQAICNVLRRIFH